MKRLVASVTAAVLIAGALAGATVASASPAKNKSCSSCHGSSSAVKITVTKTSSTSKAAKYKVKVTGGKGAAGWAVFVGGKNVARRTSSTGSFTVALGKSVKVWAVKSSSGARSKSFTSKR